MPIAPQLLSQVASPPVAQAPDFLSPALAVFDRAQKSKQAKQEFQLRKKKFDLLMKENAEEAARLKKGKTRLMELGEKWSKSESARVRDRGELAKQLAINADTSDDITEGIIKLSEMDAEDGQRQFDRIHDDALTIADMNNQQLTNWMLANDVTLEEQKVRAIAQGEVASAKKERQQELQQKVEETRQTTRVREQEKARFDEPERVAATVEFEDGTTQSNFFTQDEIEGFKARGLNVTKQTSQTINIGGDEPTAAQMALAESNAERLRDINKSGNSANNKLIQLGQIERALESGQFKTGALGNERLFLSNALQLVGVDAGEVSSMFEGAPAGEAIDAATKRLAVELQDSLRGRASNFRLQLLVDSLPNIVRSEEGNRLLVDLLQREAELEAERAQVVNEFVQQNQAFVDEEGRTMQQVESEFNKNNPFFTEELEQRFKDMTQGVPEAPEAIRGRAKLITDEQGNPLRDEQGRFQWELTEPTVIKGKEERPGTVVGPSAGNGR